MKEFKQFCPRIRYAWAVLVVTLCAIPANAQFLRSSYFMENSHFRLQMNPALAPARGYINLPMAGSLGVSATSNSFIAQDIMNVIDNTDGFYNSDGFMGRLLDMNRISANVNTDILSFGWYKGNNFWSFNVGTRVDIGMQIPKNMFEFLHTMDNRPNWNKVDFDIMNERAIINAYTEIGLGFAIPVDKRMTIGGKVKLLLGMGNMNLNIKKIAVHADMPDNWVNIPSSQIDWNIHHASYSVDAQMESSFKGMELVKNADGYVDNIKFNELGIAGYGGALDLGFAYKLTNNFTFSASVIDFGFIDWSKSCTKMANAKGASVITEQSTQEEKQVFEDDMTKGEMLNYGLMKMEVDEAAAKSRRTSLYSTIVVGGEYAFSRWLSLGALYTTRFTQPEKINELTFSGNLHPKNWFNLTFSYSTLRSTGNAFGLALKLGPLFVGYDYMYFGEKTKTANGFVGFSIPLGKKKGA